MPKVKKTSNGSFLLPRDFLERRHIPEEMDYWLDKRNGDLILHPRRPDIHKLYIEPTTACNLQCRMCIRHTWGDPIQHMSWQVFHNLESNLEHLPNLRRVIFTGFGEPLTHPRLLDMIEAARRYDLKVTIGTNGLLLNSKIARQVVRLGVDRVMVSLDGGKPETFADIRGTMLFQITDNICELNEAKRQLHSLYPSVGIEFVALRSNVDELDDLVKIAARLNVSQLLISNVLPYAEEIKDETLYSYEPIPPFKTSGWALRADAWVMWATQELPRMHWGAERRCQFVQDHATVIGWDGGVSPCYALSHNYTYYSIDGRKKRVDRYLLGSVNSQPLTSIWTSEEYVRFRSEVKGFHFPSCPDCDLRDSCDLRSQNKACWGWDHPSCADCLWAQNIIRCP